MTNESKHTPGPWKVNNGESILTGYPTGPNSVSHVATVYNSPFDHTVQAANAQLIAAAPDTLRANKISFSVLTDVYQYLYMNPSKDVALENLMDAVKRALNTNREAIAKAEGRQSDKSEGSA